MDRQINTAPNANDRKRIQIIDFIRGILIIYVVYYHFMYDLNDIIGVNVPYLYSDWFSTIRDCMSGSLIFISGFSCFLTKSNIKRGLKTLGVAMAITVITYVAMPSEFIVFGILHFMGTMMLLFGLVAYPLKNVKINPKRICLFMIFAVLMCIFFATFNIFYGYIKIGGLKIYLPRFLYGSFPMFILGFAGPFGSADYYPILPWAFLFLSGACIGKIVKLSKLPDFAYRNICRPLQFVGRHTLAIYIIHQPLLLGISYAIFAINSKL